MLHAFIINRNFIIANFNDLYEFLGGKALYTFLDKTK